MNRWFKWMLRILTGILLVGLVGLVIVMSLSYEAMPESSKLLDESYVRIEENVIVFEPEEAIANFVFYQGGLVTTDSYLVMAKALRDEGVRVFLPQMPLNLAIINRHAFDDIYRLFPSELPWYLGGHSLGAAASAYGADDRLEGLVLLAGYPPSSVDLSEATFRVLSITASHDEVLDKTTFESRKALLPSQTKYVHIDGGNHAYFGYYGEQRGDGEAEISREQQHNQFIASMLAFMLDQD